ncbi:MAG: thioesterase, partial [Spirochaetes bacterium]|nr:thioesterase [Spirochaetota bacterium]
TVVNININYISSATAGDILVIKTDLVKTGTKSITVSQKIFRKNGMDPVIDAVVTFVLVDTKSGKSVPLNERILKYLDHNADGSK